MVVSLRSGFTVALAALSAFMTTQAAPLADRLRLLSPSARNMLKMSTPAAPHFVVYNDNGVLPSASDIQGFNVFALAFLMCAGPVDQALHWQELAANQRASYLQQYNAAGISLIVSAFGVTDTPTSSGTNPTAVASSMAQWITKYGLQGIDVDYEDFSAFNSGGGSAESWLITYTQQLRRKLPQGRYILSHAPVALWFSPNIWSGGGYLAVHKSVGFLIDWYNLQFYNQGTSEYTTCSAILDTSSSTWPESSLFQIAKNGIPLQKLVIGKPAAPSDAKSGYMDPSTLASCVSQAASRGWNAGVMGWKYPNAAASWIATVRGST